MFQPECAETGLRPVSTTILNQLIAFELKIFHLYRFS